MLTFLGNILRRPGTIDNQIVIRQLATKTLSSNSWIAQIRMVLHKYQLPSAYSLSENPPQKLNWKRLVHSAVNHYWMKILKEKAHDMKTLDLLNIEACHPGMVHDVWYHNSDPLEAQMATVKARLLVQRYPLGYSHCAGKKKSDNCILCNNDEETICHFLLECPTLAKQRARYLQKLYHLLLKTDTRMPRNAEELCKLILTPAEMVPEDYIESFEEVSRRFIFKLHHNRSVLMGGENNYSVYVKS